MEMKRDDIAARRVRRLRKKNYGGCCKILGRYFGAEG